MAFDDREQIAALSEQIVSAFGLGMRLLRNPTARSLWRRIAGQQADRLAVSGESIAAQRKRGQDTIFYGAPALLIAHVRKRSEFGRDDTVYAACNLILAAQRHGLGTCLNGFFNQDNKT